MTSTGRMGTKRMVPMIRILESYSAIASYECDLDKDPRKLKFTNLKCNFKIYISDNLNTYDTKDDSGFGKRQNRSR